jgi:hypothetical protein
MSEKHRIRSHSWVNGRLSVKDNWFESLDQCIAFIDSLPDAHNVKIYNSDNNIVHSVNLEAKPAPAPEYVYASEPEYSYATYA